MLKIATSEQLPQVNALRETSHFEEASQKAALLLQKAERALNVIRQKVAELSAQSWPRQTAGLTRGNRTGLCQFCLQL